MSFSLLASTGFLALAAATHWAMGGNVLAWMVAAAFIVRIGVGTATYLALPINGHDDPDDRAGYVYTDAHRRDVQAWELAVSGHPIAEAFSRKYHTDQYGGLLALSAFVYRYLSPDMQRPLIFVLVSALSAALGMPFLWKAMTRIGGERVAFVSGWIYALYPESVILGAALMREPYLMTFSAFALWGFVDWRHDDGRRAWLWLTLGLLGMVLVSPVTTLMTLLIFAGWMYFSRGHGPVTVWPVLAAAVIFMAAMFLLSWAVNRQGNFNASTPVGVMGNFLREAVNWDVYQLERGSGWVQKLFNEMPAWLRLPFVLVYGLFQPVLPAALVEPTTLTWRIIAVLRALGWYLLLPLLVLSFLAVRNQEKPMKPRSGEVGADLSVQKVKDSKMDHKSWIWISLIIWIWIMVAALRGGGDQWDNPRYRSILFLWQAILAGHTWVWWWETRNAWVIRIAAMELLFLLFFGQWYASRYFHMGGRLEFGQMVGFILGSWGLILVGGLLWDRRSLTKESHSL